MVSACSSFYTYLTRHRHIKNNPFHNSPLPRKEYKKAVHTDQSKTISVMNEEEF